MSEKSRYTNSTYGACKTVSNVCPLATSFSPSSPNAYKSQAVNACDLPGFTTRARAMNFFPVAGRRQFTVKFEANKLGPEPDDQCVDENWLGEPVTQYGQAKRAAEEAVLVAGARFGMHVVNLRLAMVYGRGGAR